MQIQVVQHEPRIRCYKCGSTHVEGVCHHCQRAMCTNHILKTVDQKERLLSIEFTELGLKKTCGEIPIHCEFCYHVISPRKATLIISGIAILILALTLSFDPLVRLLIGFIGTGMIVLGLYINKANLEKLIKFRPPLPLLPRFSTTKIHEIVHGEINLDSNGDYRASVSSARGVLDMISNFGQAEWDQLEQYKNKYYLVGNQIIKFNAGFVALRGNPRIKFFENAPVENNTVLALTDTNVERYVTRPWRKSRKYELRKNITVPIRIVPSLIQEAAKRALDLEIQWTGQNAGKSQPTIHKIDKFEIHVPFTWGQVQDAGGGLVQSHILAEGNLVNSITWRNLLITDHERKQRQHNFSMSFENAIEVSDSIRGELVVTFKGTFSGIEGIDLFYPVGGRWEVEAGDITTQWILDFELSLADLRYQEIRFVPDLNEDKDNSEPITIEGLIPDHNTVIRLTNAISENSYYIKRIIENPPRTGEQANRVNRYWDIAGREYDGVYPIDFHLVLSGESIKGEESRAHSGEIKANLTVRGAYANEVMKAKIEHSWERLHHIICTTLEQLSATVSSAAENDPDLASLSLQNEPNFGPGIDGRLERINLLRKRSDDLFELLRIGRISEATFLKLKSEIERELYPPTQDEI